MGKFFSWAGPAINYLKPWLVSFLAGLLLALVQALIAFTQSDQPFKLSNLAIVVGGTLIVYVTNKLKHIQVKDLQAVIDGLLATLEGQPLPAQEPVTPAQQTETNKG